MFFAGTGALGFEALSRGAQRAIFAERHFPTADCLRRSSRELGLVDRVDVMPGDVLLWSRRMPPLSVDSPWIIFISPPWNFFHARLEEINSLLKALAAIAAMPCIADILFHLLQCGSAAFFLLMLTMAFFGLRAFNLNGAIEPIGYLFPALLA